MNQHRGVGRCALAFLLGVVLPPAAPAASAIKEAEDLLRGRWYAAEVIVFERLNADAEAGPEDLAHVGSRSYPANLRAMTEVKPWAAAEIDPFTRTCLEFPRLEVAPSQSLPPVQVEDAGPLTLAHPTATDPPAAASQPSHAAAAEMAGVVDSQMPLDIPIPPTEESTARKPPAIHPVLAPHPLLDLLSAAARSERALLRSSYRWLAEDSLQLRAEARRIGRAPNLQVLWHGRWMQPIPPRDAGEPLLLQAGPQPDGVHQLEGTLQVTLGRYLHFQAQLWHPAAAAIQPQTGRPDMLAGDSTPRQLTASATQPQTFPHVELNESRAMRSGELHYLDHPKIGILVRIDPVPVPVELAAALETWQRSEADG